MKKTFKYILAFLLMVALSWGLTCCFIKAISLCFEVYISTKTATGIWLTLTLLSIYFNPSITSKK